MATLSMWTLNPAINLIMNSAIESLRNYVFELFKSGGSIGFFGAVWHCIKT